MPLIARIEKLKDEMTAWRRDIHAHPELGFQEQRTSDLVAAKLAQFGIEVHRGIGKTGVVGVLRGGSSRRSVGLRADMDALPIQEANSFAHRSKNDGRMHACGHDGHTTMLLGAAKHLAETRNFDGTVHFIFQPAEEGIGGAKAMVEDGLFKRFPCDAIFGMHNRPGMPLGKFAVRSGPMMAGGAFFDIDIEGRGSHGARPEAGIDPVLAASHVTTALQSIVARNVRPVDTAVVSVTQIHSGNAYNVIPQSARLSGTVRAFSNEVMTLIGRNIARLAEGVAAGFGAQAKTDFRPIFAPLINDPQEADYAAGVCAEIVGAGSVRRDPALIMASEDFSFMLSEVPGCYINIGNGEGEGACEVHNPSYDFNDQALPYGASFFARLVEKRLAK
jgi:hippurate hydrolase